MEVFLFFREIFGIDVKIDSVLSILFNRIIIDIYDFDFKIMQKHNEKNISLNDLLIKYYNDEILRKVKYYSGVEL